MTAAPIALYALWIPDPTYDVIYDVNGGTVTARMMASFSYYAGDSVTVLDASDVDFVAPANKHFVGWSTDSTAPVSEAGYAPGQNFTMGTSEVTLYAIWALNASYGVVYDPNGAVGIALAQSYFALDMVTVASLAATGFTPPADTHFAGWATSDSATVADPKYIPGTQFTMPASDVTLYAIWGANATYDVIYNANDLSGTPATWTVSYFENQTVYVASVVAAGFNAPSHKHFVGWSTSPTATAGDGAYAPSESFVMGPAAVTLYAVWAFDPKYDLTYQANGGTGGPTSESYFENAVAHIALSPAAVGITAPVNHYFLGWAPSSSAPTGDPGYAPSSAITMPAAQITLYAIWAENPKFDVIYDSNGGWGGPTAELYFEGATVTIVGPGAVSITPPPNHHFMGWSLTPGALEADNDYDLGHAFTMPGASVELFAVWAEDDKYDVVYDANDGSGDSATILYFEGATVIISSDDGVSFSPAVNKKFLGWSVNPDAVVPDFGPGETFEMGTNTITLYAIWEDIITYTVTYEGNGGSMLQHAPVMYLEGTSAVMLDDVGMVPPAHMHFLGWSTTADATSPDPAYDPGQIIEVTQDLVFYAVWELDPTFNLTYFSGEGTGAPASSSHFEADHIAIVTPGTLGIAGPENTVFVGWATSPDGAVVFIPGDTLTMGGANISLYAQWVVETPPTPPAPPVVRPVGPNIEGDADPDTTVTVKDEDGNPIPGCENLLPDAGGHWVCVPDIPLNPGQTVTVVTTDPDGNESDPTDITMRQLSIITNSFTQYHTQTYTYDGTGFVPGETVCLLINGEPTALPCQEANTHGAVTFYFPVPVEFDPAAYVVTLHGEVSGSVSLTINVIVIPVVNTGGTAVVDSPVGVLGASLLMLMGGLWLLLAAKRDTWSKPGYRGSSVEQVKLVRGLRG